MKRSIRFRFTTLFIGMLAAVLLAIWVINSFFLEQYYINDKVKILQDAYEQLNDCAVEQALEGRNIIDDLPSFYSKDGEQTGVSRMLRVMNEQYNTTVVLIDSLNDRTFPTFWDNRLLSDLVRQYILGRSMPDTEAIISEENYKIEKRYDKHNNGYYLQNWGFFDDNRTIFIMSMPIASIHESVALSNRFMIYVGSAALCWEPYLCILREKGLLRLFCPLQPYLNGCPSWILMPDIRRILRMRSVCWAGV